MCIRDSYWPVFVALAAAIWWASRLTTKVGSLEAQFKEIKSEFENIKDEFRNIKTELRNVKDLLNTILQRLPDANPEAVARTESPIRLNDLGSEISERVAAKSIIDKVLSDVPVKSGMNEYQIQQTCFKYANLELMKNVSEAEKDRMEKMAYEKGLDVGSVLYVLGIELRDAVFKKFGKSPPQTGQQASD